MTSLRKEFTDSMEMKQLVERSDEENEASVTHEYRVYKRRWVVLAIFMMFGVISSMSWIQYSIVANVMMRYYSVSSYAVDWTSMIFFIVYVPLIIPAVSLLDKKGLRVSILVGTLGNALGSWIKVASVAPDRFAVAMFGQAVIGMTEVFLLSVPPKLAAVWFGADQVSTACSLGVFGTQFGVAVGFLLPPIIIRNNPNIEDIGADLSKLCYGMAGFSTLVFLLVVLFFKDAPPVPPSMAQILQKGTTKEGVFKSIKILMVNRGFVLLLIAYGLRSGVMNAVSTLLNQLILKYFENGETFAGRVGLVITVFELVGSVVVGVVLDKTQKYKETTLALYISSFAAMLAFTFVLASESQLLVYLTSSMFGFCLGGFVSVGFELAMEITYPEPEGTSAGVLLCVSQLFSFAFILIYGRLVSSIGDVWSNVVLCATLFVGVVLTVMIPPDMKRQAATNNTQYSLAPDRDHAEEDLETEISKPLIYND